MDKKIHVAGMTYDEYKYNGETLTEKVPYTFLCGLGLMNIKQ